jgi:hypothetical protein
MIKKITLLAVLAVISGHAFSQFTLKAELRPRLEYRGGYGIILSKDQDPSVFVSQRSRLSAYYQSGILSAAFALQDVRVWGDDDLYTSTGVFGSKSSIDLNEAWLGIQVYKNGSIKAGRQYWVYEDERIFSARGWNQSEVKYDGLLFKHSGKKLQADLGLSYNHGLESQFDNDFTPAKILSLNFIYLKKPINDWMYVSAMAIASGFSETDTTSRVFWQGTYGVYLGIKREKLNALASGYFQGGKNRSGKETVAYMFSANAEYLPTKKISIGAGIDYLSGTNQNTSDTDYTAKNHSFDILYGIRHRLYGHLDYFNNLPRSTGNGGLVDLFLKFKYSFTPTFNAGVDYHYFRLQNDVVYKEELLTRGLGNELDFYLSWDIIKILNLKGGYSTFFATDSMEKLQGVYGNARFPGWIWLMVTAKPILLDTAQK